MNRFTSESDDRGWSLGTLGLMQTGRGEPEATLTTALEALKAWLSDEGTGQLPAAATEPQSWVSENGLFAVRWYPDKPPRIVRL